MLERFLVWSSKAFRKPWPIVVAAILATAFFAFGIPKLKFDNNIKTMLRARALISGYTTTTRTRTASARAT